MRFSWQRFCTEYKVPFVTSGPNTSKGNISIHCPYCGEADHSEHMGLSLDVNKPWWGCWRGREHRGRDPTRLIVKLLSVTFDQAQAIIDTQGNNPDAFQQAIESLTKKEGDMEEGKKLRNLHVRKEFKTFDQNSGRSEIQRRYTNYLSKDRGFGEYWWNLVRLYELRWGLTGEYANRIIIPVYHEGRMVSWTSRAINPDAKLRYKTLEAEKEVRSIKDCLLFPPRFKIRNMQREALIVTEGPFDAMKLEVFSGSTVTAVCVFGLVLSNAQLEELSKLKGLYSKVVVLLDSLQMAEGGLMRDQIQEVLGGNVIQGKLPSGVKDPGDLTKAQVEYLTRRFIGVQT